MTSMTVHTSTPTLGRTVVKPVCSSLSSGTTTRLLTSGFLTQVVLFMIVGSMTLADPDRTTTLGLTQWTQSMQKKLIRLVTTVETMIVTIPHPAGPTLTVVVVLLLLWTACSVKFSPEWLTPPTTRQMFITTTKLTQQHGIPSAKWNRVKELPLKGRFMLDVWLKNLEPTTNRWTDLVNVTDISAKQGLCRTRSGKKTILVIMFIMSTLSIVVI